MTWTEIIKVQTNDRQVSQACLDYLAEFRREKTLVGRCRIQLYVDAGFSSQVMVRVVWDSLCPSGLTSHLAEVLIHELKAFGLVDHSSWKPI